MVGNEFKQYLKDIFQESGMDISDIQLDKFCIYRDMLIDWNNKMNLTAITDSAEIAKKHFLDSALLLKYVKIPLNSSIVDVGSGAGFPAVVLKIMREDINITMIDSLNKRLLFLNQLMSALEIHGNTVHLRAEESGRKSEYREKFDVATARAVAKMSVLSEYCIPLVKVGGIFAVLKGQDIDDELNESKSAIKLLGGQVENICKYDLLNDGKRAIIEVKKISQTPTKFPRATAKISKKPI